MARKFPKLWPVFLFLLYYSRLICDGMELEITNLYMDNKDVCLASSADKRGQIHWVSETKSIVLVGRSSDYHGGDKASECSVIVGAATLKASIVRLHFEALHITECGISLTVSEASTSDFSSEQNDMLYVTCGHGAVSDLHAQERHYIKVSLHKQQSGLSAYNFRINVTRSDPLPVTGLQTHWVAIIGVAVFLAICLALYILIRYLIRRSKRWQDIRRERMMERAIYLYNSQETPPESDYMYTAVPYQDVVAANGNSNAQSGSRLGRNRSSEIAFVHADGHIETFRMRDTHQGRAQGAADDSAPNCARPDADNPDRGVLLIQRGVGIVGRSPRTGNRAPGAGVRLLGGGGQGGAADSVCDSAQVMDYSGELPPSYEEALSMPAPEEPVTAPEGPGSPLYANVELGSLREQKQGDSKV